MLLVSYFKCSSCLTYISQWAIQTFHLVYATIIVLLRFLLCVNMFSIVFCVRKAIFSCVFLKILVICLTSLPQYIKMAPFAVLGSSCVLRFGDFVGVFSIVCVIFISCSIFFILCISDCFAFVVIGYVCTRFNRKLIPESLCS
jgi:hypothetical protein